MLKDIFVREIALSHNLDEANQNEYPYNIPAIKNLDRLVIDNQVTFLIGENGMGKSTLLEAIAVNLGFNAEGGSRNFNFSTQASHSKLYEGITVVKGTRWPLDGFFLRAESFYNVATYVDNLGLDRSYGGKSLHAQSHGESFLSLMTERFFGNGLYILDEPEAVLSPISQMTILAQIKELTQDHSQFIIATHSPILMAYPDATILVLDENGISKTEYKSTSHYQLTKRFLDDPDNMLDSLFDN